MITLLRKILLPLSASCCLLFMQGGCTAKRIGHPADLAAYYASHYPEQPQKKRPKVVPRREEPAADEKKLNPQEVPLLTASPEPAVPEESSSGFCKWLCSILWFCSNSESEQKAVQTEPSPIAIDKHPQPLTKVVEKKQEQQVPKKPKIIPHWQKSGKHRRKEKLFIGYTPRGIKDNRYFHNIKRIGIFLKQDITLAFEYGTDTDVNIPIYVQNMDLEVIREGIVLRKYMDNSFYIHIDFHNIYLAGNLYFDDADFGGRNQAYISSTTQTLSFGIGNEWYVTRHVTLGLDWFTIPTIISRSYSFGVLNNGNTDKTRQLNRSFSDNDPVSAQARLWGGLVINLGVTF